MEHRQAGVADVQRQARARSRRPEPAGEAAQLAEGIARRVEEVAEVDVRRGPTRWIADAQIERVDEAGRRLFVQPEERVDGSLVAPGAVADRDDQLLMGVGARRQEDLGLARLRLIELVGRWVAMAERKGVRVDVVGRLDGQTGELDGVRALRGQRALPSRGTHCDGVEDARLAAAVPAEGLAEPAVAADIAGVRIVRPELEAARRGRDRGQDRVCADQLTRRRVDARRCRSCQWKPAAVSLDQGRPTHDQS